jgi:hypothetical protein
MYSFSKVLKMMPRSENIYILLEKIRENSDKTYIESIYGIMEMQRHETNI